MRLFSKCYSFLLESWCRERMAGKRLNWAQILIDTIFQTVMGIFDTLCSSYFWLPLTVDRRRSIFKCNVFWISSWKRHKINCWHCFAAPGMYFTFSKMSMMFLIESTLWRRPSFKNTISWLQNCFSEIADVLYLIRFVFKIPFMKMNEKNPHHDLNLSTNGWNHPLGLQPRLNLTPFSQANRVLVVVFWINFYTSEAMAIVSKTFRSITHQENTWTTRNKDITQIYTGWTFTCANFTYNNLALRQINIRLNTHTSHTKKKKRTKKRHCHLHAHSPEDQHRSWTNPWPHCLSTGSVPDGSPPLTIAPTRAEHSRPSTELDEAKSA